MFSCPDAGIRVVPKTKRAEKYCCLPSASPSVSLHLNLSTNWKNSNTFNKELRLQNKTIQRPQKQGEKVELAFKSRKKRLLLNGTSYLQDTVEPNRCGQASIKSQPGLWMLGFTCIILTLRFLREKHSLQSSQMVTILRHITSRSLPNSIPLGYVFSGP